MTSNSGDKIIKKQVDTMQVSFDKEAAWMRLQDRMESKDERRRPMWMGWAAAAMLVVGTVLWYGLSERTENVVVKKATPNESPAVMREGIASTPVVPEKDEPTMPMKKEVVKNKIKAPMPAPVPMEKPEEKELKEPVVEPPVAMHETIVEPPVVVTTPKKKMKRVHINDMVEDERAKQRADRQEMYERYAAERKNSLVKPATEREDAERNTYSLLGMTKTEIN